MERGKIKILYIITKSNFGGAQRYVYDLATNLPKTEFEILVAFGGNGLLKEKLEAAHIRTVTLSALDRDIGTFKEFLAFLQILGTIKNFEPELIHLNSSKAGILGGLAARFYNLFGFILKLLHCIDRAPRPCQIVFTAHGWAFKEKRKFMARKLIEYSSWLTVVLSHTTIVVSNDDREKVRHFIFIQSKIKLVHNGIETPHFISRDDARAFLSEKIGHSISNETLLAGTVAELHKNKGLDYVVEAMKTAPRYSYIIIGTGEDREKLQGTIEKTGLNQRVFLAGQIKNAASFLKAFDLFILPSLKEGLPYALLEAGAAGVPVIATDVGGVPEIIDDMSSGIVVKAKRPKEIAEAIAFLIEYPEKKKEFGEKLQKTVAEKFTLERMVKETVAVYRAD